MRANESAAATGQPLFRWTQGTIKWRIDGSRTDRPYWCLFIARASPIDSLYPVERTLKFYTYLPAGGVKLWEPPMACAVSKLTNCTWLKFVGNAPLTTYPEDDEACIEDSPDLKE